MTTVNTAQAAQTTSLSQSSGATAASADGANSTSALADYDDFLSLLTAQLRNQDPLNPQDSTEFVEQIATFTGVEQQLNTNTKLDELIAAQTGGQIADLAQWVGSEVSADGLVIDWQGGEASLTAPPGTGASDAAVVIKDLNGVEIARLPVDPGGGSVIWDGTTADGVAAERGQYQVEFAYTTNTSTGPETRIESGSSAGRVIEARLNAAGETELVLQGGLIVVKPADVNGVFDSASATAAAAPQQDDSLIETAADTVADAAEAAADAAEAVVDAATGA